MLRRFGRARTGEGAGEVIGDDPHRSELLLALRQVAAEWWWQRGWQRTAAAG